MPAKHSTEQKSGNGKGLCGRVGLAGRPAVLTTYFLKTVLKLSLLASLALGACAPAAVEAASTCGTSSYYGPGFHGRPTASGERFNSQGLTAAHRSLPLGSRVKVTNQANGQSVLLRINDRGPAYGSRIIDLSEGAFAQIASRSQGLAQVCISKA